MEYVTQWTVRARGDWSPQRIERELRPVLLVENWVLTREQREALGPPDMEATASTPAMWRADRVWALWPDLELTSPGPETGTQWRFRLAAVEWVERQRPVAPPSPKPAREPKPPRFIVDDQGHRYPSLADAAAGLGCSVSAVKQVAGGRLKSVKGRTVRWSDSVGPNPQQCDRQP